MTKWWVVVLLLSGAGCEDEVVVVPTAVLPDLAPEMGPIDLAVPDLYGTGGTTTGGTSTGGTTSGPY